MEGPTHAILGVSMEITPLRSLFHVFQVLIVQSQTELIVIIFCLLAVAYCFISLGPLVVQTHLLLFFQVP
jgi:hypothetical protein